MNKRWTLVLYSVYIFWKYFQIVQIVQIVQIIQLVHSIHVIKKVERGSLNDLHENLQKYYLYLNITKEKKKWRHEIEKFKFGKHNLEKHNLEKHKFGKLKFVKPNFGRLNFAKPKLLRPKLIRLKFVKPKFVFYLRIPKITNVQLNLKRTSQVNNTNDSNQNKNYSNNTVENYDENHDEKRLKILKNIEEKEKLILQAPDWNPKKPLLEIKDLHVIENEQKKEILKGINLTISLGERHTIMGRNGSGKSTLAKVIAGHPDYTITKGDIFYKGLHLNNVAVNIRSLSGIFLAFQYPVELPMVQNKEFLRAAVNCHRKVKEETELSAVEFNLLLIEEIKKVGLTPDFLERPVNYGFSGGEKKRNEILQMLILKPCFCIFDETDSGLDVDSFKLTANVIKNYANKQNSFLIVTHYKKLLELLKPDYIHIMHQGKIMQTGNYSLVDKIESEGFAQFLQNTDELE